MRVLLIAAFMAIWVTTAQASLTADDQAAIKAEITEQMADFRRDDAKAAFAHATPALRELFGSVGAFVDMVRRSYGPVYRPVRVEFGQLDEIDGGAAQLVEIVSIEQRIYSARYTLEKQPDGRWRISGCELLERSSTGV